MIPDPRLNFLAELREAVGLTQREVARRFELSPKQGYKSVASWEKGESIPKAKLRTRFIRYLLDDLRLHNEPTRFINYWDILVECWHWEPLSDAERATLHLPLANRAQGSEVKAAPAQTMMINGTSIGGNVITDGGDMVGRDKIIHQHGYSADDVVKIMERAQRPASPTPQLATAEALVRKDFEPETVLIPSGAFWMGRDDGAEHERPRHAVTLPAYAISQQSITNAQYAAFVQQHDEHRPRGGGWRFTTPPANKLNEPVTGISWHDAVAYCAWLTLQSGRPYRLASEAEWEKAAQSYIIVSAIREWTSTIWGDDASAATFTYPYEADGRENLAVSGVYRIWRSAGHPAGPGRGFAGPSSRLNDLGGRVVRIVETR